MLSCSDCEKKYSHESSLRRHVLKMHGGGTKRKGPPVSNGKGTKNLKNGGDDTAWRKKCQAAWNKVIREAVEELKETDDNSHLSDEDLCKDEHLLNLTVPAVMRMVEAKLTEAECLRESEVGSALKAERKKLIEHGMAEWEAKLMAPSNRKYLLARHVSRALKSKEDGDESEDGEKGEESEEKEEDDK